MIVSIFGGKHGDKEIFRYETPCAKKGECEDCSGPGRMCNVIVRMQYPTRGKEVHVVLIGGDFGY